VDKINLIAPSAPMGELGKRARVKIEPGYSQLDWARLKSSGADLRVSSFHCHISSLSPPLSSFPRWDQLT
jgi:hypothetical protein